MSISLRTGFSLLLFLVANLIVRAGAAYSVKGTLIDSLTNDGVPFATVRIIPSGLPETAGSVSVTDADGKFHEELLKAGAYRIQLSSVGKHPVWCEFSVSDSLPSVDLGILRLRDSAVELEGVDVVAQKPLVKADIDKISYSVEDDPDSKTSTTLEMLRKVPFVTVDGEGNIKVKGSGNFKVYVNGKPNTLMSSNPKEVLRSLPAGSVKAIEVITDPGAKYDAEGVGGILNIVTAGTRMQGYNVTLGTQIAAQNMSAYGYGTVQMGKFTLAANYAYVYQDLPRIYQSSSREDFTAEQFRHLSTAGYTKNKSNNQIGNLEGSFEIDTLNLITFSANVFAVDGGVNGETATGMQDRLQNPVYSFLSRINNEFSMWNIGVNADYQRSFRRKGEFLTVSYRFSQSPNNNNVSTSYEDMVDVPSSLDLRGQYFENGVRSPEHTVQIDYVNPVTEMHYVDGGMKFIYRKNASDGDYFMEQPDGTYEWDEEKSSHYDQRQNILAVYADYQLKWKKFGVKAGVRYEHTFMDVKYAYDPARNFGKGFDDVVPTVNLSYMLGAASSLKATYNVRINRPGIWFLNPFRDTSNPAELSYGNPDLETEKSHSFSLSYSYFSAKFNVNVSAEHRFVNNGIEGYSFMNNGVYESTFGNVGKTRTTGLSLWLGWNPTATTRISLNAMGQYADYESAELNAANNGFWGSGFLNFQQTLPWDLTVSAYGGGSSPWIGLQGNRNSNYYYGLSLNRSFLKDKRLSISLFASNMFHERVSYSDEEQTDTFRSFAETKMPMRSFGISINWRFGELKASVKKTVRSIQNDDMKSGGGNAGAQSAGGGA